MANEKILNELFTIRFEKAFEQTLREHEEYRQAAAVVSKQLDVILERRKNKCGVERGYQFNRTI